MGAGPLPASSRSSAARRRALATDDRSDARIVLCATRSSATLQPLGRYGKPSATAWRSLRARHAGEGRQHAIEPKLLAVLADEVEHQTRGLAAVRVEPQPPSELLHEQSRAHGGAQEQERIDKRQIDALVVEVAGEDHVDIARAQAARRVLALGGGRAAVHRQRRHAARAEVRGHEASVLDADAEAEGADAARIGHAPAELSQDQVGAGGVAGVEIGQGAEVVAAAAPAHVAQIASRRPGRSTRRARATGWSSACQRRSSAATWSSKSPSSERPSCRSGVAVSPTSSSGRRCGMMAW